MLPKKSNQKLWQRIAPETAPAWPLTLLRLAPETSTPSPRTRPALSPTAAPRAAGSRSAVAANFLTGTRGTRPAKAHLTSRLPARQPRPAARPASLRSPPISCQKIRQIKCGNNRAHMQPKTARYHCNNQNQYVLIRKS